ncbi:MAG TPA: L-lactate permease [Gemmatimonadaceae bacterium]|nr:L-lactate permease [Gemmatimonadaceae bacterium]
MWPQNYSPLGSATASTLLAALPLLVLLGLLAARKIRAHVAALLALGMALVVAIGPIGMPAPMAAKAALLGAAYGFLPIGWIILNVIFLYNLANERELFEPLKARVVAITGDRRLQLLLIAFCFGAFFEGAAGFGTPVAVTGAILIGLGFPALEASALSLIANTAPVAFGALGTPIIALAGVTSIDARVLSAMVGRQLPIFSLIVPFWLICAYVGFRRTLEIWPALLVAGVAFAVPQFLVSNFHGPWLVDIIAAICSMVCLTGFLKVWSPSHGVQHRVAAEAADTALKPLIQPTRQFAAQSGSTQGSGAVSSAVSAPVSGFSALSGPARRDNAPPAAASTLRVSPWLPWILLSVIVFVWGLPNVKAWLDAISAPKIAIPGLDKMVMRMPPVVLKPTAEPAVFTFNWLSASGTAILIAAIISGFALRYRPGELLRHYGRTLWVVRHSLLTISAMLALGYTTRYSGEDAILGLAFAHAGVLYPFFGTLLGWLGVALTGSDTASNVLFGSLQKVTAQRLGLSPILMSAANSSGGVMGKMIDAQSIVVASTATRYFGQEWRILRYVFFHSLALATLVGLLVLLQQYVFTGMLVRG